LSIVLKKRTLNIHLRFLWPSEAEAGIYKALKTTTELNNNNQQQIPRNKERIQRPETSNQKQRMRGKTQAEKALNKTKLTRR